MLAQGIEAGAPLLRVRQQTAAEGGVVQPRVVYRTTDHGQRPGRIGLLMQHQLAQPGRW
ncbi:hypothetical protein D3C81_1874700 [compost metagenome]